MVQSQSKQSPEVAFSSSCSATALQLAARITRGFNLHPDRLRQWWNQLRRETHGNPPQWSKPPLQSIVFFWSDGELVVFHFDVSYPEGRMAWTTIVTRECISRQQIRTGKFPICFDDFIQKDDLPKLKNLQSTSKCSMGISMGICLASHFPATLGCGWYLGLSISIIDLQIIAQLGSGDHISLTSQKWSDQPGAHWLAMGILGEGIGRAIKASNDVDQGIILFAHENGGFTIEDGHRKVGNGQNDPSLWVFPSPGVSPETLSFPGAPPLITAWKWMKTSSVPSSGAM